MSTDRWYRQLSPADWKAFWAAWLGYAMDGFDFVLISLVLTEVAHDFHLSTVTAATLVSAAFISRWLGGLAIGAVGDRFGRRPAMVLSIALYAVGSALCGFSWDYWSLFVFRLVIGLGMAGEYTAGATYVIESWPDRMRNLASGMLLSGFPIGSILAAKCYAWIVPQAGWRALFYVGVIPVVVAIYLRRRLPEAREWRERAAAREAAGQGAAGERAGSVAAALFTGRRGAWNVPIAVAVALALFMVFRGYGPAVTGVFVAVAAAGLIAFAVQFAGSLWPVTIALMVTVFCAFLYSWPLQALLPTYLKTDLGYDPGQVSDALLYAGLGYAAGSVLAGFAGDRFGTTRAYAGTLAVSLLFVAPVFLIGGGHVVALWVLLFCLQATGAGISGILPKFIAGHFPVDIRAGALGFSYNVGALGGAVAPVLGARLARPLSLGTAIGVLSVLLTAVVIVLVGLDVPARVQRWATTRRTAAPLARTAS